LGCILKVSGRGTASCGRDYVENIASVSAFNEEIKRINNAVD
jgi:hypothetical protein